MTFEPGESARVDGRRNSVWFLTDFSDNALYQILENFDAENL